MSLVAREIGSMIDTSRFALRPLVASDESLYCEIYCDANTMRYVGEPLSVNEATRSFRTAVKQTATHEGKPLFVVAIDNASGSAVGICGATLGVPRLDSAEVGILLKPDARGKGCARDVLGSFIDLVFLSYEVDQVWVNYAADQKAVVRLNEGLGFVVHVDAMFAESARQTAFIQRDSWPTCVKSVNRG